MAWVQDVLLDSKTSQIFLMTVHWVVNMLWLNSVMRHILQKSTWGEFFSCCWSNNKQPFYTSKLLMLPKDTILEVQVRPYSHLFNWKSKCSNQGPVPISLIQPFGQQGLQWLCLVNDQLILKASFKVFNWTKKTTKIFLYFCPSFKKPLESGPIKR